MKNIYDRAIGCLVSIGYLLLRARKDLELKLASAHRDEVGVGGLESNDVLGIRAPAIDH